jgi:hypothetical protein
VGRRFKEITIFRTLLGKVSAFSHSTCEIILKQIEVYLLEMEDVLFHHNSAVMMPKAPAGKSSKDGTKDPSAASIKKDQEEVSGIKALAIVFKQFEFDPDKRLLIVGHTDTSGKPKYNFELSDLRAKNVLYLLMGEKEEWAKVCLERHKIEDYQQILLYVHETKNWPCDPVGKDDKWGPRTENATKQFISYFNKDFAPIHNVPPLSDLLLGEIKADSSRRWPLELWEAAFSIYNEDLAAALEVKTPELDRMRSIMLYFVDDSTPFIGCGESFPIDHKERSNYRSQANRRVELLFFDKDETPLEKDGQPWWYGCQKDKNATHKESDCPLWHKYHFIPMYIDRNDLNAIVYHLKFIYYNRIKQEWMPIPEIPGMQIRAFESRAVGAGEVMTQIPTVTIYKKDMYYVKVCFPDEISKHPLEKLHFEFETLDTCIFTEKKDKAPEIQDISGALIAQSSLPDQMHYYDIPAAWNSRNWYCEVGGSKGDFADMVKLKTSPAAPMVFNLDDIVLVAENGSQDISDKDKNDNTVPLVANAANSKYSRYSLFHIVDNELLLFNPLKYRAPYFTNAEFARNLITHAPPNAVVINFANDFYSIWNKRAAQGADPYNPEGPRRHVRGCRAAKRNDHGCHLKEVMDSTGNVFGHSLFFAEAVGNFELHYIHNGCIIEEPKGLKVRTFLIIYWNARFELDNPIAPGSPLADGSIAHQVIPGDVDTFATEGLDNAFWRWQGKDYTFEPLDDKICQIQIKPVFFLEAKDPDLGGKEKCKVTVSNDPDAGEMSPTDSKMYWEDYQDRDYLQIGSKFKDIDGLVYETLVVAHEVGGHALGKNDEYAYKYGDVDPGSRNPDDEPFSQYYLGMPYNFDTDPDGGSMMVDNRAPRMHQLWFFVNWINAYSRTNAILGGFLNHAQYKIAHRFKSRILNYFLPHSPNDYRDIYKAFKSTRKVSTGTGSVDLALYKLGEDEMAWNIKINNNPTPFPFDGILAVFIKIAVNFVNGAAGNWIAETKGIQFNDMSEWLAGLSDAIKHLNNCFYISNSKTPHDFRNTYIFFFPVCLQNPFSADSGLPAPNDKVLYDLSNISHYNIRVILDGTSDIKVSSGKNLSVGNDVDKQWIVNYILGKDDGAAKAFFKRLLGMAKPGMSELKFILEWFKHNGGSESFELKDR